MVEQDSGIYNDLIGEVRARVDGRPVGAVLRLDAELDLHRPHPR